MTAADIEPAPDVAAIRKAVPGAMTQTAFAKSFGFSFAAVRDWEQGRRKPDRAARIVLTLIQRDPATVLRVLLRDGKAKRRASA